MLLLAITHTYTHFNLQSTLIFLITSLINTTIYLLTSQVSEVYVWTLDLAVVIKYTAKNVLNKNDLRPAWIWFRNKICKTSGIWKQTFLVDPLLTPQGLVTLETLVSANFPFCRPWCPVSEVLQQRRNSWCAGGKKGCCPMLLSLSQVEFLCGHLLREVNLQLSYTS
jgi:hypothetical protein